MFNGRKILAIIPARGGSKGLKNKNILPCAGKPLIAWTIEAGLNSKYIDKIVVSTDSPEIAQVCQSHGIAVPFLRPHEISGDLSSNADVINFTIERLASSYNDTFDFFIFLQPTSPLRDSGHLDRAIESYLSSNKCHTETLISVYAAPSKVGWLLMRQDEEHLKFCFDVNLVNPVRQDLPTYFLPNGAIMMASTLRYKNTFYGDQTRFFLMDEKDSIDIDNQEDFDFAEKRLIQRKQR